MCEALTALYIARLDTIAEIHRAKFRRNNSWTLIWELRRNCIKPCRLYNLVSLRKEKIFFRKQMESDKQTAVSLSLLFSFRKNSRTLANYPDLSTLGDEDCAYRTDRGAKKYSREMGKSSGTEKGRTKRLGLFSVLRIYPSLFPTPVYLCYSLLASLFLSISVFLSLFSESRFSNERLYSCTVVCSSDSIIAR